MQECMVRRNGDDALSESIIRGLFLNGVEGERCDLRLREVIRENKMLAPLIVETRQALDAKLFRVALQSALTLPDICGSVEYPELKDNIAERYIRWCEAHLEC